MRGRAGALVEVVVNATTAAYVLPVAAAASLGASMLLVRRLECLAGRFGLREAMLGLLVALAADGPEITSAVSALLHHHATIGAGVALGSNAFNLAALLGLSAVVAGRIDVHPRTVALEGVPALAIAGLTVAFVCARWHAWVALAAVGVIVVPYVLVSASPGRVLRSVRAPLGVQRWVLESVAEEEADLSPGIHPLAAGRADLGVAVAALAVVIVASAAMERATEVVGARLGWSDLLVGGLVLAAITSLPNAVSALYLARRGRGAAVLSTAMNSNMFNVLVGLLVPATLLGIGRPGSADVIVAASYLALTALCVVLTSDGRLSRPRGAVVVAAYVAFVVLVATW